MVPLLLVWHWPTLRPANVSLPVLIEAANTALLAAGFGLIATVIASVLYLMFPHQESLRIGFGSSGWKASLIFVLVYLFPPQLMWFKRIRRSLVVTVLIAFLWGFILIDSQIVRLSTMSPYMIISVAGFGVGVVGFYLNKIRRINSGA